MFRCLALVYDVKEKKLFMTLVKGSKVDFIQGGPLQRGFIVRERYQAQLQIQQQQKGNCNQGE